MTAVPSLRIPTLRWKVLHEGNQSGLGRDTIPLASFRFDPKSPRRCTRAIGQRRVAHATETKPASVGGRRAGRFSYTSNDHIAIGARSPTQCYPPFAIYRRSRLVQGVAFCRVTPIANDALSMRIPTLWMKLAARNGEKTSSHGMLLRARLAPASSMPAEIQHKPRTKRYGFASCNCRSGVGLWSKLAVRTGR